MPLPDRADLHRAARIFQGLAHPHRIQIACCLAHRPATTQKDLVDELGWPQSTVARHIAELRARGLVRGTREGNQIRLELAGTITPKLLAAVCDWVHPDTHEAFASAFTVAGEAL